MTVSYSGLTDGSDVTQTDTLWKLQGDDATMDCKHSKEATFYQMYWYRQLPGEPIRLMATLLKTPKLTLKQNSDMINSPSPSLTLTADLNREEAAVRRQRPVLVSVRHTLMQEH